ncbi:MAG: hypothetical protein Q4E64_08040 [Phascolarctobacterium sp.]|uniref:hypothetical protein n=1 Tax=Phascolarctobacterium sp. TaxID=2049039 RepID=UPI0026DAFF83|nr:hypothetical protein [Phascolarctobacterium sp.]MDO4921759.1 hypothetical protein [Phascolarctobacterium sp.]
MANYCMNQIYFCAKDRTVMEKLFRKMRACFENIGYGSVYDLFLLHGYVEKELNGIIDRRDDLTGCDGVISSRDGYYYFGVETQTAWQPHMENFYKLISERYANDIRIIYCSEEAGLGVYVTNDVDGIFFKDRFRLSYGDGSTFETEYFASFSELLDFIRKYLCDGASELDDIFDLERKITGQHIQEDKNYYCRINRLAFEEERKAA